MREMPKLNLLTAAYGALSSVSFNIPLHTVYHKKVKVT